MAVHYIQLGGVDHPLVRFHDPLVLLNQRLLRGQLLFGNGVLGEQYFIARQIDARVIEQGLVPDQLSLGLHQRGIVGTRIDLDQRRALLHDVALFVMHFH